MNRKTLGTVLLVGAVATGLLGAVSIPAGAQELPPQPGEPSLHNFEHLYNFSNIPIARGRGTDVEFYTPTVPLRDRNTGEKVLDEDGNEILLERDFAIMGSYNNGAWVFDITDPEDPFFVRNIPCNQQQNDVQIKKFGDRWVLALARDGTSNPCVTTRLLGPAGRAGIAVFDVTDPYEFEPMYSFRVNGGAHNFTFHPTKPFGWVSTGDLPGLLNWIPIINFTDVDNPTLASQPSTLGGPHDIVFSPDGDRAYVASENNHQIWDSTNPGNPTMISQTPNVGTYSHGLDPTPDGNVMVATNESLALGGFFTSGNAVCPGEGMTFYDIEGENEENPRPVGQFMPAIVGPNVLDPRACTGHVGRVADNSAVMVTGWYQGGVRVVDFSNPSLPRELGHAVMPGVPGGSAGGEVWAAKFYKGPYVYAADMRRGFDVYKWTGGPVAPWETGEFTPRPTRVTSAQATADGSELSVTGSAAFGGQAPVTIATDPAGDGPVHPDTSRDLGVDLTAAKIYQADPDDPALTFELDVTNLPSPGQIPEGVRYLYPFQVGATGYQLQAKLSNLATTTLVEDPEGHVTNIGKSFQVRGNCGPGPGGVTTCAHLGWLDGEFDTANNRIRMQVPIGSAPFSVVQPGARLDRHVVANATIVASYQAVLSLNPQTSDEAVWEEGVSYTVPSKSVQLGVAPAGTDPGSVTYSADATVDEENGFAGSVETTGLAAGSYEVFVRACFSGNCDVARIPFTV